MQLQGFDYFVTSPDSEADQQGDTVLTREEYAEWGFGYFADQEEVDQAVDAANSALANTPDPNSDYYKSLDQGSQEAYGLAMDGDGTGASGCRAESANEVSSFSAHPEVVAELRSELDDIVLAVDAEPTVAAKRDEVYACAADGGYDIDRSYEDPMGAGSDLVGDWFSDVVDYEPGAAVEVDDNGDPIEPEVKIDEDERVELHAREVSLATRIWDCGYPEYLQAWWKERERRELIFIDDRWPAYQARLELE